MLGASLETKAHVPGTAGKYAAVCIFLYRQSHGVRHPPRAAIRAQRRVISGVGRLQHIAKRQRVEQNIYIALG